MLAVPSALLHAILALAVWCAASVVAVPVLARCVRAQARVNARVTRRFARESWTAASHRR